ncbi:hypothetical protein I5R65_12570 [Herbaspirillum sp. AP02]|uniref:hypothetical protein n=1 Tax=unclassified Herbaspirillum TaxID=2624150 RepID=UPI0015DA7107|nr:MULTISPECIES: hypothetical protein [unclassified Herbaspirillum]MBG7620301.1 hypothetical protein [Herbaspirillum sp. AP02]NZD67765.1 hypothetical protein [Herbaspirillum sp. AP21]
MHSPVDHQEQYKGFRVSLRCSGQRDQWEVSAVHIVDTSGLAPALFPRRHLPGRFNSAALAIERGMGWARAVIDNLDPALDRAMAS